MKVCASAIHLYLVGGKGDKIIRGGEQVDPREVERVVDEFREVYESAVIGVSDAKWGEIVMVLVVPSDSGHPPDVDARRSAARATRERE